MSLPQASPEQIAILLQVNMGRNVKVEAVAGSGKTTTMLHIAKNSDKTIVLLTYNARLKDEMREKIRRLALDNVEAHSYHAFCVRYYNTNCSTDSGILDLILRDSKPRTSFRYGLILLDEVQDMTPLYYKLVIKIIRDMHKGPAYEIKEALVNTWNDWSDQHDNPVEIEAALQLEDREIWQDESGLMDTPIDIKQDDLHVQLEQISDLNIQLALFGDPKQNIYAFKDADERYLTLADYLYKVPRINSNWYSLPLSYSFRVTKYIADFVNDACLKTKTIVSNKPGAKVHYMICGSFGTEPATAIKKCLTDRYAYGPGDVFIVAPSVRSSKSAVKKLENALVAAGYPCFVPIGDDEVLQQDIIKGKVVFSSIHQTKGLERKIVMLYGFDASYFKFYNRTAEPTICPNELYVALTRAQEHLFLIHDNKKQFLPFLDQQVVYATCDMTIHGFNPKAIDSPERSEFSVTELTRHLTIETMKDILAHVQTHEPTGLQRAGFDFKLDNAISIPSVVKGEHGDESICDINGICLPAMYEYKTQSQVSIIEYIRDNKKRLPKPDELSVNSCLDRFAKGIHTNSDFLYISNVYNSLRTGYMFKLRQVVKYDWLEPSAVNSSLCIIQKYITPEAKFEHSISRTVEISGIPRNITGCIDAITATNPSRHSAGNICIWEFKCCTNLQPEHIIQLLIYSWLFSQGLTSTPDKIQVKFYLFNILTDTIIEIVSVKGLDQIIERLIQEKIKIKYKTTDEEFMQLILS